MPTLTIFTGNIGSGKSLVASKLANMGAVVFNMDSYQSMLSGGEYGRYDNAKKELYQHGEDEAIKKALSMGFDVVVDRTNMDRKRRERFINIGHKYAAEIVSCNWGPGNKEQNLYNRSKDTRGVPMSQWEEVFDFMYKSYEPPTHKEGFDTIVTPPEKYNFYAFDFDGTIVKNEFPDIGDIIDGTVRRMNELYKQLSNVIIIWTCRHGEPLSEMRKFCVDNKIPFDFINKNPLVNFGSNKIYAHEYIDDRNGFVGVQ